LDKTKFYLTALCLAKQGFEEPLKTSKACFLRGLFC